MKINFLKKLLYVPNYLLLQVAGIEICNKSIKYIEFFNKNGVLSVKNYGEVPLSQNIVRDGDIINKQLLVKALIEVKKNITSDFVRVSIPEEKTYIFDSLLPKEAKANLREALEFTIEENVPLKLNEASFEYEIVDDKKSQNDILLSVSVIPDRIIFDYAEVLDQSGLYPTSFELGSKMVAKSVIKINDKKNYIVVNIKDDSTVLIGVINGIARITSSIPIGENAIRERLLKTGLFTDELIVGDFFENDFSFETTYSKESYSALVNIFSILKDEIEKFNDYVITKFPDKKESSIKFIDSIILCGRSATLPGLAKHINQNINTQIILADVWTNVFNVKESPSNIKFHDSLNLSVPIGLVLKTYK